MNTKRGITLIEILFAIIIFGAGILSIINVIVQNISLVDNIKNQTTATFLAKEGMEIIYNLRDSNIKKSADRRCSNNFNANYECAEKFAPTQIYKVGLSITGYYDISFSLSGFDDNVLYYHTDDLIDTQGNVMQSGFWYDHKAQGGIKTFFSRYIYFDKAFMGGDNDYADPDKLLKLESHVQYKKGAEIRDVVMESFIGQIN